MSKSQRSCVLAIGNFDGVHRGHALLLAFARWNAERMGLPVDVLTFHPMPAEFLAVSNGDTPARSICTLDQRVSLLNKCGVDRVSVATFDAKLQSRTPQHFVERLLKPLCVSGVVVVGKDFRFGHQRSGDAKLLTTLCRQNDLRCQIFDLVVDRDTDEEIPQKYASGKIRQALYDGDLASVNAWLGYSLQLTGKVVRGDGRGKTLGFATVNMHTDLPLPNLRGVFVSSLQVDGKWLQSITNIGTRPTFAADDLRCETHVPEGLDRDLCDTQVTLALHHFLRSENAFAGTEDLIAQLRHDVELAQQWHRDNQPCFAPIAAVVK